MVKNNDARVLRSCYIGYVVQAVINNLLPLFFVLLHDNYNISFTKLGSLVMINFISQLFVDLVTVKIVRVFGTKKTVLIANLTACLGIGGLAVLPYIIPTYIGLIICIIFYALGSGLIEVLISPIADALVVDSRVGNMSFLHSFYCWGQFITILVTTVLIKLSGASWRLVPLLWAVLPLVNFVLFSRLKVPEIENAESKATGSIMKNPVFYIFLIMMLAAGASEITMAQWASTFAEEGLGVSKVLGDLLGPCLFAVFMGTGRVLHSMYAKKVDTYKILAICSFFCIACYLVAAFSPFAVVSLAACALCGFTVSIMWPSVLSLAAVRFSNGGSFMFSAAAVFGDLGCCVGPWILGIFADNFSFQAGFSVATVFPLVMLVCAVYMYFNNKKRSAKI